jgi:hypothetical protein
MTKNKRNWLISIASVGILAILGALFVLNSNQILLAVGVTQPTPAFSFNESKASGWWAAENYNSQVSMSKEKDYQGDEPIDKLSVASMNVFKGKKGDNATACFVMFSYYDYKTDIARLKAEKDAGTRQGDSEFQNVGDVQSTISTPEGVKSYTLTKYELSGPGTENSMKGMSYGWVELDKGYIQVSGVCPTAVELGDTVQISEAVSLAKP